ncbi:MAG: hypothetical protein ABSB00_02450 [Minisyncoccia bacterium]
MNRNYTVNISVCRADISFLAWFLLGQTISLAAAFVSLILPMAAANPVPLLVLLKGDLAVLAGTLRDCAAFLLCVQQ